MQLSPRACSWLIRPKFAVEKYIRTPILDTINVMGKRVLDFGCGTGSNAFIFDEAHYSGVDIDRNRIVLAKKKFPNKCFFVFDGVLPFEDESFDYVCIIATMHHIDDFDFEKIFHELKRVLRPEGSFVVLEPVLLPNDRVRNWLMTSFDAGRYIRNQQGYLKFFKNFDTKIITIFTKFYLYNEILFLSRKRHVS